MTTGSGQGRTALLRDYPLRLWALQNEYFDSLLRESSLLLVGQGSAGLHGVPPRLLEVARELDDRFGGLLRTTDPVRQAALDAGLDRIDVVMPLPDGTPELLAHVRVVLEEADGFCRREELLALPRTPELVAFGTWAGQEMVAQYGGAEPTPWPGPF